MLFFPAYTGYKWNDSQWSNYTRMHCTNLPTTKDFLWLKRDQELKRWHTACSSSIRSSSFSPSVSLSTWPISRSNLPKMLWWWTRSTSLAFQMSCRWCHKATSVWELQGVLEWLATQPGMWWRMQGRPWSILTPNQVTSLWLTLTHTHIYKYQVVHP